MVFRYIPLLVPYLLFGQEYNREILETKLAIKSVPYPAFKTFIDFEHKAVEKAWWKFARDFGKPVNMRGHYQTTIPGELHGSTRDIILFTQSLKYGRGAMFYIALNTEGLSRQTQTTYLPQMRKLLAEFKQGIYVNEYQQRLTRLEKKAAHASRRLDRSKGNAQLENKWFEELEKLREEMERVRGELRGISD